MICIRCKTVVKTELTNLGLHVTRVELGMADISEDISPELQDQIRSILLQSGLELSNDSKHILIEKIKKVIIELVHYSEDPLPVNLSVHLAALLNHNYTYMSNVFSDIQGCTIEKFLIEHKIARAKELIIYNELTLSQIALKMHYCSVAHLSAQFKKVTGHTVSYYKHLKVKSRSMLEEIGTPCGLPKSKSIQPNPGHNIL